MNEQTKLKGKPLLASGFSCMRISFFCVLCALCDSVVEFVSLLVCVEWMLSI